MLLLCVTYILKTDGVTTSLLPTCWTKESLRSVLDCIYLRDYLKGEVAITNKMVLLWWGLSFCFFFSPFPFGNEKPQPGSTWPGKCFPSFRADLKARNLPALIIPWPSLISPPRVAITPAGAKSREMSERVRWIWRHPICAYGYTHFSTPLA